MNTPEFYRPSNLLSVAADHKTVKGSKLGFLTGILYLSPADIAGDILGRNITLCPYLKPDSPCKAGCLYGSGGAIYRPTILPARENKTVYFFADRSGFYDQLEMDIARLCRKADRENLSPLVRFNGTSDIAIERQRQSLFDTPAGFYDYTKGLSRMVRYLSGEFPENYDLTFSWGGDNRDACETVLSRGGNVSVPFYPTVPVGETFLGAEIISGDETDVRLPKYDGRSKVIGLKWKSTKGTNGDLPTVNLSRAMASGFCVETDSLWASNLG